VFARPNIGRGPATSKPKAKYPETFWRGDARLRSASKNYDVASSPSAKMGDRLDDVRTYFPEKSA
jgi:hypothetical protein